MKVIYSAITSVILACPLSACGSTGHDTSDPLTINEGDKLQALVNIHGSFINKQLSSLNYQSDNVIIPVCSEVIVEFYDSDPDSPYSDEVRISYKGQQYKYIHNGHIDKAGQSLEENFHLYFGKSCDKKAINNLSKIDKYGIKLGKAKIGMSKQGVIFAMGYPPIHHTPSIEDNYYWVYWQTKLKKIGIEFSPEGKVAEIN